MTFKLTSLCLGPFTKKSGVNILLFILLVVSLSACGGGGSGNNLGSGGSSGSGGNLGFSVNGKAQKGAFLQGASVVATHLTSLVNKDNKTVSTTVRNDSGDFTIQPDWQGWTEINITGRFYDENSGSNNPTELTLDSIAKIGSSSNNKINVNLFTHFIAARTRKLVNQDSKTIEQAWNIAQLDLIKELQLLGEVPNLEQLDLSDGAGNLKNNNAILLLFSGGYMASGGNASSLLTMTDDFANDGKFNGNSLSIYKAIGNYAGIPANFDKLTRHLKQKGIQSPPDSKDLARIPTWVNQAPKANIFPAFKTILQGQTLTLSASASVDPEGGSLSYSWAGDGTARCGDNPHCSLSTLSLGDHRIIVGVTDEKGSSNAASALITIRPTADNNSIPVARLSISDDEVRQGATVTLDASRSSDNDGDNLSFSWIGAGTGHCGNNNTCIVTAITSGVHVVKVVVKDGKGGVDSAQKIISVTPNNAAPFAYAGEDKFVFENQSVFLSALSSTDVDGNIVSYVWSEGNVNLGSGANVTLRNLSLGTHIIKLTVTDNEGASGSDTVRIVVKQKDSQNQTPNANAGLDKTITEGERVTLDASASNDPDGSIVSFQWKRGAAIIGVSQTLVQNALPKGSYTYTLTVTDNDGASSSDTVTITVLAATTANQAPVANAGSDKTITEGASVTLDASASNDPDGSITKYLWKKGSTIKGTNQTLVQNTLPKGTHTYTLTVTDNDGASSSDTVTITVKAPTTTNQVPKADAGQDKTILFGDSVTLDASASTDPDGNIVAYKWIDINNNVLGSVRQKLVSNLPKGVHVITLEVTDNEGATSTDDVVITVIKLDINVDINTSGCGFVSSLNGERLVTLTLNGNKTGRGQTYFQKYVLPGCAGGKLGIPLVVDTTYSIGNIKINEGVITADMEVNAGGQTRIRQVTIDADGNVILPES